MRVLPLDPPSWASSPSTLPTAAHSEAVRGRAIARCGYTPKRRLVETVRKAGFALTPSQKRLIPIVGRYQQNAQPEVFAAFYTGIELAVACATTELESKGENIYGADPASYWMNSGPYGELWEHTVVRESYLWFGARVDAGATSNGVGQKQLTSRSLQRAADARGGCWVAEHCCAEGDVFMLELIHQTGSIWAAAYAYNGAGPAAVAYANEYVAVVAQWRARVG